MLYSGEYNDERYWTGAISKLLFTIAEMAGDVQSHDSSSGYQEYAQLFQEHLKEGRSTQ